MILQIHQLGFKVDQALPPSRPWINHSCKSLVVVTLDLLHWTIYIVSIWATVVIWQLHQWFYWLDWFTSGEGVSIKDCKLHILASHAGAISTTELLQSSSFQSRNLICLRNLLIEVVRLYFLIWWNRRTRDSSFFPKANEC